MPRNILIIFLLILALLALGATTFYLTLKGKGERIEKEERVATLPEGSQTKKVSPEPEKIVTQPQESSTEPIDTSDWKVYRNEKYGFEVKYPEDWVVETYADSIRFGERKTIQIEDPKRGYKKVSLFEIGFSVKVYPTIKEMVKERWPFMEDVSSLEDWVAQFIRFLKHEGEKIELITFGVGNYKAYRITMLKQIGVVHYHVAIIAEKNGRIYYIKERVLTAQSAEFIKYDYKKVFQEMLSTFRFLE